MTMPRFENAIHLFDEYNAKDPNRVLVNEKEVPEALLYARRMSGFLVDFEPAASEELRLAARCQHIGRWEIPRSEYPMDRPGYLKWRSQLKIYHCGIAEKILKQVGYEDDTIRKVKDLLMKRNLKSNPQTQTLEDVICLVFLEFYFDDFSEEHEDEKVIGILSKTLDKMSERGIRAAHDLSLSEKAKEFLKKAAG